MQITYKKSTKFHLFKTEDNHFYEIVGGEWDKLCLSNSRFKEKFSCMI